MSAELMIGGMIAGIIGGLTIVILSELQGDDPLEYSMELALALERKQEK